MHETMWLQELNNEKKKKFAGAPCCTWEVNFLSVHFQTEQVKLASQVGCYRLQESLLTAINRLELDAKFSLYRLRS